MEFRSDLDRFGATNCQNREVDGDNDVLELELAVMALVGCVVASWPYFDVENLT